MFKRKSLNLIQDHLAELKRAYDDEVIRMKDPIARINFLIKELDYIKARSPWTKVTTTAKAIKDIEALIRKELAETTGGEDA